MKLQQSSFSQSIANKNIQHNVFLFYGSEFAIISELIFSIKTTLKTTHEFTKISQEDTDYLSKASNEFFTYSMFGEKKIVYIENYKKTDFRKINEILEKIPKENENILILSQNSTLEATNSIRKICESTPHFASIGIYGESENNIKTQIKNILNTKQIICNQEALNFFSQIINPSFISSEISKIETYFLNQNEKILTKELISKLINTSNSPDIFTIPILILEHNLPKFLHSIDTIQQEQEDPFPIFFAIQSYIKKLYLTQTSLSNGENIETLLKIHSIHFSQIETFKKHLQEYKIPQLSQIITKLNSLEAITRYSNTIAFNAIKHFAITIT